MRQGGHRPWAWYALGLVLGLGAMGWITGVAIRTERAEKAAQGIAAREAHIRLALWRMDSTMALFLAPEAARPWTDFEAFHSSKGALPTPSPVLVADDPLVLLRFQIRQGADFSSPLLPRPGFEAWAGRFEALNARQAEAVRRLGEVKVRMSWDSLRAAMTRQGGVLLSAGEMERLQQRSEPWGRSGNPAYPMASPFQNFQGAWVPFWEGDRLFMARQVWLGSQELLQGCWLDWVALKEVLMSTIRDILPKAELKPLEGDEGKGVGGRMASLPVRVLLEPHQQPPGRLSPSLKAALAAGWGFAILGALAGAFVLYRTTTLSEQRGSFASAVAHELRTPLTTFRIYTELLAHRMVTDEAEQQELHQTLLVEADRLDHLVKNILAFARLETHRGMNLADIEVGALLDRVGGRLMERAQQGGLRLERLEPEDLRRSVLRTDALVVEQILFNLVDNACKYAGGGQDRTVQLNLGQTGGWLVLHVQDGGPGIPEAERKRLFKPFQKVGSQEARRAPGVGLGLALCRRLARMLGGDLVLNPSTTGACFSLRLPKLG